MAIGLPRPLALTVVRHLWSRVENHRRLRRVIRTTGRNTMTGAVNTFTATRVVGTSAIGTSAIGTRVVSITATDAGTGVIAVVADVAGTSRSCHPRQSSPTARP